MILIIIWIRKLGSLSFNNSNYGDLLGLYLMWKLIIIWYNTWITCSLVTAWFYSTNNLKKHNSTQLFSKAYNLQIGIQSVSNLRPVSTLKFLGEWNSEPWKCKWLLKRILISFIWQQKQPVYSIKMIILISIFLLAMYNF